MKQALADGYAGLWATVDSSREYGPQQDFSRLLENQRRLEEVLQEQPALRALCQYHADTLRREVSARPDDAQ